ncbi:unnamed protein product [Mytilus coruscus]|uniref:WSC domain-containing protein n=1 Tax=Mytilus coruscus TaxID=42192 RepID=A0A6J8CMP5_MYTCO|nr:unnamed protein product [Mytilus coruscus]
MLQLLSVFHVVIVLFCRTRVTHSREQPRVFLANETHEWFDATRKCTLLKNEKGHCLFAFPNAVWMDELFCGIFAMGKVFRGNKKGWNSTKNQGCFKFRDRLSFNGHEKQVTEGEQLKECIIYCKISQHFGLQNSICVCLPNSYLTDGSIEVPCDTNVTTCSGDPFAFCGRENSRLFLSVYQKD